jgi:outer membrane protein OmpA-like peptidoglycan-associated protein
LREEFVGCPDTDGDGIPDPIDLCPTEAGLDSLQGCPFVDTDGDGIQDKYDECPQTFGPIENGGCPYADTDGDSVFDKDDDCPMTPGTVANNGCPEIEEEEQEVLNTVFNNLQFQSGKAVIMESSFQSLDDLANLLIKKADFKLLIEGHTDDVGREMANMSLSQNRVMAVKNYLVSKGIDEKRFVTKWYGESNPIAPNDTEEGRAKNRRVELNVVFD